MRLAAGPENGHAVSMTGDVVDGIDRATFGAVPSVKVNDWLRRHVRARLDTDLAEVLFRTGRVSAVYGLRLSDDSKVVVKVHRGHLDEGATASLTAAVDAQRLLADAGYPCPTPLSEPASTDGLTATIETLLDDGAPGDAHQEGTRTAIATSLAEQMQQLRALPAALRKALRDPPAWAIYQQGPWPTPHDPIFDFTTTPDQYAWLDEVADGAATLLTRPAALSGERVVGHGDWYCGNLRFTTTGDAIKVASAWDWDSLVCDVEPVIAGMAAASFVDSSLSGAQCPTPEEAAAFLADYDAHRPRSFTAAEHVTAAAAVTWTLAYNARCQADVLAMGTQLPEGSVLSTLATDPAAYLNLPW